MNTQQPPYNPMANMMQILQLAMQQNQAGQAQANQDRNFGLEQQQVDQRGQQFDAQLAQQVAAQQAEQEYRAQQSAMQQQNHAQSFGLAQKQFGLSEQQLAAQLSAQEADRNFRQQQAAMQQQNQDRGFGLEAQKLDQSGQQFQQQFGAQQTAQQAALKQQEQQAILAALSRAIPQNAQGFDDPSVLFNYLKQIGVQLPEGLGQPQVDPEVAKARAIFAQLGQ